VKGRKDNKPISSLLMASLNKIFLIGNLTNNPELRQTQSGASVARFGLAINQRYKDTDDEQKESVCFVNIVAWNELALAVASHLKKGKSVFIEGKLQYRTWEQEGKKRNKLEVVAKTIQFLSPARKE